MSDLVATYSIDSEEKKHLLAANKLNLNITKTLESSQAYDSSEKWKFKDFVDVTKIEDLNLNVNMGVIDLALGVFKQNTKEDSEVYHYIKEIYEKIQMNLNIGEINLEFETFEVDPDTIENQEKNHSNEILLQVKKLESLNQEKEI